MNIYLICSNDNYFTHAVRYCSHDNSVYFAALHDVLLIQDIQIGGFQRLVVPQKPPFSIAVLRNNTPIAI